jgi:hypothetical protein
MTDQTMIRRSGFRTGFKAAAATNLGQSERGRLQNLSQLL